MSTAKSKKAERGRPENPKYQETIRIDDPPEAVAKSITKGNYLLDSLIILCHTLPRSKGERHESHHHQPH